MAKNTQPIALGKADLELDVTIGLNAVIVAVTNDLPRVLTIRGANHSLASQEIFEVLPFGPLDPRGGRTLEKELRGWVSEQTGLELGYVEQLYTFGDRNRDPIERSGGPRVLSVAYLALAREREVTGKAEWQDYYAFLPWEDWRLGAPEIIGGDIIPALFDWAESSKDRPIQRARRERISIAFGLVGSTWDSEKVLERYELLYEAALIPEAHRDLSATTLWGGHTKGPSVFLEETRSQSFQLGRPMALDHRRMLATALARLRGKIKYRPVVFEMIHSTFTLLQLQRVVEALAGILLHKQNFRRLVDKGGLVAGTGQLDAQTGGRPAEIFRFRRDVLRERRAPGVGFPGG